MQLLTIRNAIENVHDDLAVMVSICEFLSNVKGDDFVVDLKIVGDTFADLAQRIKRNQESLDKVIDVCYSNKNSSEVAFRRCGDHYEAVL